jgi:regulator of sirC expression with transglutaminase-like and TPR domain
MKQTKEINALIQLLDDSDEEVLAAVEKKLLEYGKNIIPNLESAWETIDNSVIQEKIEDLIHIVNFTDVKTELKAWAQNDNAILFDAFLLLSTYRFNNVDVNQLRKKIKAIYQSIWLEMNSYLTPMEQINIMASVFYNMYKLKITTAYEANPNHYFINHQIEHQIGTPYTIGVLFVHFCYLLDIPVKVIDIPNQFLLGYVDLIVSFREDEKAKGSEKILFYIDPCNGMIYTKSDVEAYLKKNGIPRSYHYERQLSNHEIVINYLKQLVQLYGTSDLINIKEKELLELIEIIEAENK